MSYFIVLGLPRARFRTELPARAFGFRLWKRRVRDRSRAGDKIADATVFFDIL
jgi:hypothetical protein